MSHDIDSDRGQSVFVKFIDVLFAVVLGQSFVILNSILLDPETNLFRLGTIFVVYALVITSWYGYHHSVAQVPIASTWRWLIDVMLLFVYYAGFVAASDIDPGNIVFTPVLFVFVSAFVLYSIWDTVRIIEYHSKPQIQKFHLYKRLGETALFTGVLIVATVVYIFRPAGVVGIEWGYLVGITALLIVYRIVKLYKRAESSS